MRRTAEERHEVANTCARWCPNGQANRSSGWPRDIVPTLAQGLEREELAALVPKAWKLAHPDGAVPPLS
jgi:hypothetical protein